MTKNTDSTSPRSDRTPRASRSALRTLGPMVIVASLLSAGCASEQTLDGPAYPALTQSATVDVQVSRDSTEITMTNTTAKPLPAGRMWINAWFSREFPGLGVGQSLTLDLYDFKDRYNVAFNGGGFFATQRPDRVVQAQLHAGATDTGAPSGELIGLVVIHTPDE